MLTRTKNNLNYGWFICALAALFYCFEFILRILPGVLQTELMEAFGNITPFAFGQLAAWYYFAYSPMQIPVGILMDRFGARKLLTLACFCCALGSLMFMDVSSVTIASMGRFLVGLGSAFAFVGILSLAVHWLPRKYFSLMVGLSTTLAMLGIIYGEIAITSIAGQFGLQYVLSKLVYIGMALTIIIFLFVRDTPKSQKFSPTHESNISVSNFFKQVGKVLISSQVWLIGIVGACIYASLSIFGELWGKTFLEKTYALTKDEAARAISMLFLGWAVGAPIIGYISDQIGRRVMPLLLGAIGALVCIIFIIYGSNFINYWQLNILLFLYGIFSGAEILVFVMAKENSKAQLSGTVFAATNMIVSLGGAIFQPLVGYIYMATLENYQKTLVVLPGLLVLMIVILCFLKDTGFAIASPVRTDSQ